MAEEVPAWMRMAIAAGDLGWAWKVFEERGFDKDSLVFHYNRVTNTWEMWAAPCYPEQGTLIQTMTVGHDWEDPE